MFMPRHEFEPTPSVFMDKLHSRIKLISNLLLYQKKCACKVATSKHGVCGNVTWYAKMSQMSCFQNKEGQLELVFGGNFCQLHLEFFTKC
jgi:hypothetical protein